MATRSWQLMHCSGPPCLRVAIPAGFGRNRVVEPAPVDFTQPAVAGVDKPTWRPT
jgi:hypothetical protein